MLIVCLLQIRGTRALERALHERFWKQHSSGEWFSLTGPLAYWLKQIGGGLDFETASSRKSARARIADMRRNEWDEVLSEEWRLKQAAGRAGTSNQKTAGPAPEEDRPNKPCSGKCQT